MKSYQVLLLIGAASLFIAGCATPAKTDVTSKSTANGSAAECAVTQPIVAKAPENTEGGPATGDPERWYVNEDRTIWMYGEIPFVAGERLKVAWFRPARAVLEVSGRRLDASAPPLEFDVWTKPPYRNRFTPSSMTFPTEGCWEITAKAEGHEARFVINVPTVSHSTNASETLQDAIAAIKKLGGRSSYIKEQQSYRVSLQGPAFNDATLTHVVALNNVHALDLVGTNITDEGLAQLKDMKTLRFIQYSYTRPGGSGKLTDAGLAHLGQMKQLTDLSLWGNFTDSGLAHLSGMTQLTSLYLISGFGDAGVEHLAGLTNLKSLGLRGTRVTDAGMVHLKGMTLLEKLDLYDTAGIGDDSLDVLKDFKQLRELVLKRTSVTPEGIGRLQKALPDCWII